MIPAVSIYILLINLIAFVVFGIDKRKARKGQWRVPESSLFILALIGGSIGALLGMLAFRHKTKHRKFTIGIPLILALQIALLVTI